MIADAPFDRRRAAALALLNKPDARLSRRAGSFLGQTAVDASPLSEAQAEWLGQLLAREGLTQIMEAR